MSSAAIKQLIREVVREELGKGKLSGKKGGGSSRKSIHKSNKKKGGNRTAFSKTKLLESADEEDMQKMCKLLGTDSSGGRDALIPRLKNKMTRDNWLKLDDKAEGLVHGLGVPLRNMFKSAGFKQSSVEYENPDDYRFDVVLDSFR